MDDIWAEAEDQKQKREEDYKWISWITGLDVFFTSSLIAIFILWSPVTISATYAWTATVHILHLFSWFIALAILAGSDSQFYNLFFTAIYFLAAFLDFFGGVVPRIALIASCGRTSCTSVHDQFDYRYVWASMFAIIGLVCVDIAQIVMGFRYLVDAKIYRQSAIANAKITAKSNFRANLYLFKIDISLYRARNIIRGIYSLDILLLVALIIIFALGVSVNNTFAWLLFFQLPHAWLWIGVRAIAGSRDGMLDQDTPPDAAKSQSYIKFIMALSIIAAILDFASFVWRLVIMIDCHTNGICSSASFEPVVNSIFSWLTCLLNLILLIISITYAIIIPSISYMVSKETARRQYNWKLLKQE